MIRCRKIARFLLLSALSACLFACLSGCKEKAALTGRVEDVFKNPLDEALVRVEGTDYSTRSDKGEYKVAYAPGEVRLLFEKEGYLPRSLSFTAEANRIYAIKTVRLYPKPDGKGLWQVGGSEYVPVKRAEVNFDKIRKGGGRRRAPKMYEERIGVSDLAVASQLEILEGGCRLVDTTGRSLALLAFDGHLADRGVNVGEKTEILEGTQVKLWRLPSREGRYALCPPIPEAGPRDCYYFELFKPKRYKHVEAIRATIADFWRLVALKEIDSNKYLSRRDIKRVKEDPEAILKEARDYLGERLEKIKVEAPYVRNLGKRSAEVFTYWRKEGSEPVLFVQEMVLQDGRWRVDGVGIPGVFIEKSQWAIKDLDGFHVAQAIYRGDHKRYGTSLEAIDFVPAGVNYDFYFKVSRNGRRYTAYSVGNIDADPFEDVWRLKSGSRTPVQVQNDAGDKVLLPFDKGRDLKGFKVKKR